MRTFKTRPFARFTHRECIADEALCDAVERAERGLVDADLGGGVIKQRIAWRGQGRSGGFRTIVAFRPDHPLDPFRIRKALHGAALSAFFAQHTPERRRVEHIHRLPLPVVIAFERSIRALGNHERGSHRERRVADRPNGATHGC